MGDLKVCSRAQCSFGGVPQPIENFYREAKRKDGLASHCKACRRDSAKSYQPSAESIAKWEDGHQRWRDSEHGKAVRRAYHLEHREARLAARKANRQRPEVKAKEAERRAAYRERNKIKDAARMAVFYALKTGTIMRPSHCQWCGQQSEASSLEGHHWLGYDPAHWLDVKFVHARPCHLECENVLPGDWP